jgi:3-hydroxybutyryl-CoA dehydrogenase
MMNFDKNMNIGVLGAGTMGAGIAQVASTAGHNVVLCDTTIQALEKAISSTSTGLDKLVSKSKIEQSVANDIMSRITTSVNIEDFASCGLVIEAIVEDLSIKQKVFAKFESVVNDNCILASNTSSLSIGSIASICKNPERVIGLHFFNPAHILPLVEVVPSILSDKSLVSSIYKLMKDWGKTPVIAKDTPGFIVNKVARPFYGEALRIYEENIADFASIDSALKTIGGFRMGPFELMDLIGNDINYKVTETVFTEFYFDGRYMPSITQKRYSEAGLLGRKSGRGFYDYSNNTEKHISNIDEKTSQYIFNRVLVMLINEAVDTLFRGIASREDIDLAVTKGVNYPKGLLKWADEIGIDNIYNQLKSLYDIYLEDRYRPCPLLLSMAQSGSKFYQESE